MNRKTFFVYGFLGPEGRYKCVKYWRMNEQEFSVGYAKYIADRMRDFNPSIKEVYLMDNQYELYSSYRETVLNDCIENNVVFRDYIQREGVRII